MALQPLWQRLAQARAKRRWSLAKTAQWFGVSFSTYWRWEEGLFSPVGRNARMADVFVRGWGICPACGRRFTAAQARRHGRPARGARKGKP